MAKASAKVSAPAVAAHHHAPTTRSRKEKATLVVALSDEMDAELDRLMVRLSETKTIIVRRALLLYFHLKKASDEGGRVQIKRGDHDTETLLLT